MTATIIVLAVVAGVEFLGLVAIGVLLLVSRRRTGALRRQLAESGRPAPLGVAGRAVKAVVETAVKVRDHGVGGMLAGSLEDLTRWATEDRAEIARVSAPDGTVTILFSDIENSTTLNERLGDHRFVSVLGAHDRLVREHVERHDGHVVKTQGDGFMVVFRDPASAARAALGVQQALRSGRDRTLRRTPVSVRIGMHTGRTITRDGDYFGRNVAMGARVAARAHGGDVLVSDDVHSALTGLPEFTLRLRESVPLKGLTGTHTIWSVHAAE